jgi:hypothetical protein
MENSVDQKYATVDASGRVTGFYMDSWHAGKIPADAIKITDEVHAALLEGQSSGLHMHVNQNGTHELKAPPPPTAEQKAIALRQDRNARLQKTDSLVARHQDETLIGEGTTLTGDEMKALLKYRASLRALPEVAGFPDVKLPLVPVFVKE